MKNEGNSNKGINWHNRTVENGWDYDGSLWMGVGKIML